MRATEKLISWRNGDTRGSAAQGKSCRSHALLVGTVLMLALTAGSGWAAEVPPPCPTSPNFPSDFSANGSCLALNGNALLVPNGNNVALQITPNQGSQTGSAWYVTPQAVQNGFSTTFQFQFTTTATPADGIAFLIQNSIEGTGAIALTGGNGGAMGYGDADSNVDPSQGPGISHSVAIEFDTYQNPGWDPQAVNNSVSHVAIQSCGMGPNTSHHGYRCASEGGANSTLGSPVLTPNFADGAVHNVTITYVPACTTCDPATVANIQVVLDSVNLYPNGVAVDLSSIGLGPSGTAFVGFTGATGGSFETQDLLSWTFAPTQGAPIDPSQSGSLSQSFVANNTPGQHQEFDFDYSVANGAGLTIQPGTTPFVTTGGVTPLDWASIVKGTAMADAPCLTANGQSVCAVSTLTCTTNTSSTRIGANCPKATTRSVLFAQETDLNLNQPDAGIVNGKLTIPNGYAPGLVMAPDVLVSGAQCNYPAGEPLETQLCPQNILTQLEDATVRSGGTGTTTNSSYVIICCEPEWQTSATIPLWTNSTKVHTSFTSTPPATPIPDTNNFHAAQGASVVVGAEPRDAVLDTTYPLPGEQTLSNTPCPVLGVAPTPWSTQVPQAFNVSGWITTFDNNGNESPLVEGAYDAHYFSVDCDSFEELVYPGTIDLTPGPPASNVARFKTVPFNIDTTAPNAPSITLSPAGGYYAQNSAPTATVTCTDPSSANITNFFSGIAKCAGQTVGGNPQTVTVTLVPIDTSTVGSKTFTAAAVDVAGNTSANATVNYQVVGTANVAAAMAGNLLVKTGTNMTYYISVVNIGPNTANGVALADTLPAGTSFVSSGYAIESCSFGGTPSCSITAPKNSCGSVAGSCTLGNLAAWTSNNPVGALVAITVHVNAPANTTLTDTAAVSEVNVDSNPKNNSTKWSTLVTK